MKLRPQARIVFPGSIDVALPFRLKGYRRTLFDSWLVVVQKGSLPVPAQVLVK
jgi:hypothetical protein